MHSDSAGDRHGLRRDLSTRSGSASPWSSGVCRRQDHPYLEHTTARGFEVARAKMVAFGHPNHHTRQKAARSKVVLLFRAAVNHGELCARTTDEQHLPRGQRMWGPCEGVRLGLARPFWERVACNRILQPNSRFTFAYSPILENLSRYYPIPVFRRLGHKIEKNRVLPLESLLTAVRLINP